MQHPSDSETIESPCIRRCCLDENDVCLGCFRHLDEIVRWAEADRQGRLRILENAAIRRSSHETNF